MPFDIKHNSVREADLPINKLRELGITVEIKTKEGLFTTIYKKKLT